MQRRPPIRELLRKRKRGPRYNFYAPIKPKALGGIKQTDLPVPLWLKDKPALVHATTWQPEYSSNETRDPEHVIAVAADASDLSSIQRAELIDYLKRKGAESACCEKKGGKTYIRVERCDFNVFGRAIQELQDKFYPTKKHNMPKEEELYWRAERMKNGDRSDLNEEALKNSGFFVSDKQDTSFITYYNCNQLPAVWSGWKVHLSVAAKDVPRATAIIAGISLRYNVQEFKVTRPPQTKEFSEESHPQTGKNFTLYDSGNENWPKIMMEIETRFRASGIAPSHPVRSDKQIKGSRYAYYRNDLNPETGKYIDAHRLNSYSEEIRYNPFGQKDLLQNIDVGQCPHQSKPHTDKTPKASVSIVDAIAYVKSVSYHRTRVWTHNLIQ